MPRRAVNSEARLRSLNLKTTEALRAKLEKAAARSGRPLTHEVEARLTESFEHERLLEAMLGVGVLGHLFRSYREVIGRVLEDVASTKVMDRAATGVEIRAALDFVSRVYFPDGEKLPNDPGSPLRHPKPSELGIRAAYDWFAFRDHEMFEDREPPPKYELTLKQVMTRKKDGSFKHPYRPDDAE